MMPAFSTQNDYRLVDRRSSDEKKVEERRLLESPSGSEYDEERTLEGRSSQGDDDADARIPHKHHNHTHSFKGHIEEHFDRPEIVRDIILGLSDGLTVPFALAAGLSSLGDTRIVIYGGLAELVSGAISMGLGGYLAARSEADHYITERQREEREVELYPDEEEEEIVELFEPYGLDRASMEPMLARFRQNTQKFVDFMMRFELNLEVPDPNRAWISALTIGLSYLFGGLIPLIPYMVMSSASKAMLTSVIVTSVTLLVFGYIKSIYLRPAQAIIGALQTLFIGAVAAACSYGIVAYVNLSSPEQEAAAAAAAASSVVPS